MLLASKSSMGLFLLILSIVGFPLAEAQGTNMDSLWAIWNNSNESDTNKLKAMHNIALGGYLFTQPDSTFYFAQLEYDFAKSKGLKKQMAAALNTQGVSFMIQGNYPKAIRYYTQSLTISKEIGNKKGIATSLNNIGNIYLDQGDYPKAIDYHARSLTIKEEIGNKKGIAASLNNIGMIYAEQGDYAKAIQYHIRSLTIKEEIGNKKGIAASLHNIGVIYIEQGNYAIAIDYYTRSLTIKEDIGNKKGIANSLVGIGNIYSRQGDYLKAINYYTQSLTIQEELGNKNGIASCLVNIGVIYKKQGDSAYSAGNSALSADKYTNALDYYNRSLTIKEEIGDKKGISISLNNIGIIYKKQGYSAYSAGNAALTAVKYSGAIKLSTRALTIAQEIGIVVETRDAANALYEVYKATGKHKQALEMYERYIEARDSINSKENQKEVIRQEFKYKFEKAQLVKKQEENERRRKLNEKLERRDNLQYSVVLICLLVIGVLVAMLGKLSLPVRVAEGIIFFSFLILFEFILVLADPYIDAWSGGAPGIKLLFNAGIAALIFPAHAFFESKLKRRIVKA